MDGWEVGLAKLFKSRDNPTIPEATTGKIINPPPAVKIGIGDEIILDAEDVVLANRLFQISLIPGDEVILIPSANGQMFYVIDKVGE